jgi:hypothetical protein
MQVLVLAATFAAASCWGLYDRALAHSAALPHPPYVSYSERIDMFVDGETLLRTDAHIDYRDDGVARVSDERFHFVPLVTRSLEPGPPEIGPYGPSREFWMPAASGVKTIAAVRAHGSVTCAVKDVETLRGRDVYHLAFSGANPGHPHLDELWIDTGSLDVWRLIVTAAAPISDANGATGLSRYEVDLAYHGPYLLVDRVTWSYRQRVYSQQAEYSGDYTLAGYSFPPALPPSYFGRAR